MIISFSVGPTYDFELCWSLVGSSAIKYLTL